MSVCVGIAGHLDCISSLVGSGADINAKDKKHYTPLHSAAAGGQSHAVKLLLELGADVSRAVYVFVHVCMCVLCLHVHVCMCVHVY